MDEPREKSDSVRWEANETGAPQKDSSWYWVVGIIAGGVAAASIIAQNFLLAMIAIVAAFTVMLAGSRRGGHHSYCIDDRGVRIDTELIPFARIKAFAIYEDEPRRLSLRTASIMGIVTIPLGGADFRAVRSLLKNRSIDEEDPPESLTDTIADAMGI